MFIIFSFVVVIFSFIFILFILLVYVSTYLFHVYRSLYLYDYLEGKAYLLRAIIVRGVPTTLYFSLQITFIVVLFMWY